MIYDKTIVFSEWMKGFERYQNNSNNGSQIFQNKSQVYRNGLAEAVLLLIVVTDLYRGKMVKFAFFSKEK